MADNNIKIIRTETGLYRAVLEKVGKFRTIKISTSNKDPEVVENKARNIIRLVAEAVDLQWFEEKAYDLYVLGPAHDTTGGGQDAKHLTITVKPSRAAVHLYLDPDDDQESVLDTTKLDYNRDPRKDPRKKK